MSKKIKKNFKFKSTGSKPKSPKIVTSWALNKLYYKSENDPQIEKDVQKVERAYMNFAKKYKQAAFTTSPTVLRRALDDIERIASMPESSKPGRYFSFRHVTDTKDHVAEKKSQLLSQRLTKVGNQILFFELQLGKISKQQQKKFLADEKLKKYRYYLERLFLEAKHDLTEAEERIVNLLSGPSYGMWADTVEKIISNRTTTFQNKKMPLVTALENLNNYPSREKPKLWATIMNEMDGIGEVAENELTAIVTTKKILDEQRGYEKPHSATVLNYHDDIESVEALVAAVSSKGFALSKKFYKTKSKLHNKTTLDYSQKYDPISGEVHIPFTQAVEICRDVFYGIKNDYGEIFDRMLAGGQMDVFPKAGKRGGAFMSGGINMPTHVFLNHTNDLKSLKTLAHEMGHAIHTERTKHQPFIYQDYSTTAAETASTLFESLLFDAVYQAADDTQKAVLLHDDITQSIATIQRQIAFFNFELEMHETIRKEGTATHNELKQMMVKHLRAYLGPAVDVKDSYGSSYVYVPHFRYGFYVYTYAYGHLISSLMSDRYKQDKSYLEKIDTFLKSGESASVANLFKSAEIDTGKVKTFTVAMNSQEQKVKLLAKLTRS